MNAVLSEVLVAQSPDALIATHPDGRVALWNRAAEATFGYTAEEAHGRPVADLIVPRELRDDEIQMRMEALDGLGARHEVLRTRFISEEGEGRQVIAAPDPNFEIPCLDCDRNDAMAMAIAISKINCNFSI